jgi:hypothetical protein
VLVFKEKKEWLHLGGATKAPEVLFRYCMRGSRLAGLKERCAQVRMNEWSVSLSWKPISAGGVVSRKGQTSRKHMLIGCSSRRSRKLTTFMADIVPPIFQTWNKEIFWIQIKSLIQNGWKPHKGLENGLTH